MTAKQIREYRRRAKIVAMKSGAEHIADDVASAVIEAFLRNGKGQTVDQAAIQAIRDYLGDSRSKYHPKNIPLELVDYLPIAKGDVFLDHLNFEDWIRPMPRADQILFKLYYRWRFSQRELAELWGSTPGGVAQMLALRLKNLRQFHGIKAREKKT